MTTLRASIEAKLGFLPAELQELAGGVFDYYLQIKVIFFALLQIMMRHRNVPFQIQLLAAHDLAIHIQLLFKGLQLLVY